MEHLTLIAYRGLVYRRGYAPGLFEAVSQSAPWKQSEGVQTRISKTDFTDVSYRVVRPAPPPWAAPVARPRSHANGCDGRDGRAPCHGAGA